jgi:hypothetical protein
LAGALAAPGVAAQERTGFIDLNAYWDSRSSATYTVNLLANLPHRFQYFSFVNYSGPLDGGSAELDAFYAEHHLRWGIEGSPVDLTAMWNLRSGVDNDALFVGSRLRLSDVGAIGGALRRHRLNYSITANVLRIGGGPPDGWAPQVEQVYRWDPWPGQVYLSGFADHNFHFNGSPTASPTRTVMEHQVGYRLTGPVSAVLEWRYNQYLPGNLRSGWGFGLQYTMPFAFRS